MKNTSQIFEFALVTLHPEKTDLYAAQYPEFVETVQKLEGFHSISTFFSIENPTLVLDFATWESAEAMAKAGEEIMASEAGQRLFAPIAEVKLMEATKPVFESGSWTGMGTLSLIVYRLNSARTAFDRLRDDLYSKLTAVSPDIAVRQFESLTQPGLFFDLFQSSVEAEEELKRTGFYTQDAMKTFEATIHPPEYMFNLKEFTPELLAI